VIIREWRGAKGRKEERRGKERRGEEVSRRAGY
jgi:hypothetical protein